MEKYDEHSITTKTDFIKKWSYDFDFNSFELSKCHEIIDWVLELVIFEASSLVI